ncbi:helix-turn-helix transcriptional regulator [Streptomyces sp. NPDC005963]|uniref:helix-turn-helix domain-containing protein n=1 Tax=Streptomyces sp. NPDC005963 TaxID=3156721 RepID=UPI0033F36D63
MEHHTSGAVEEFGSWLRDLRIEHGGLTYDALCRKTGIPRSTIADAFSGKRLPAYDNAQMLVAKIVGSSELEEECRQRWVAAKKAREGMVNPVRAESASAYGTSKEPFPRSTGEPMDTASEEPSTADRRSGLRLLVGGILVFSLGISVMYGYRAMEDRGGSSDGTVPEGVDRDMAVYAELLDQPDMGLTVAAENDFIPSPKDRKVLSAPYAVGGPKYFEIVRNSANAIEVESVTTSILLTNKRDRKIKIVNIGLDIVERGKPWAGTLFCIPPQAGSPNMQMFFDLDSVKPIARTTDEAMNKVGPSFFFSKTIDLEKKGQETLAVRAVTKRNFVAFRLLVTYVIDQERKVAVIDHNGRPFRVTGLSEAGGGNYAYSRFYASTGTLSLREVGRGAMEKRSACQVAG